MNEQPWQRYEIVETLDTQRRTKRTAAQQLPARVPVWLYDLTPYYSDSPEAVHAAKELMERHACVHHPTLPVWLDAWQKGNELHWVHRAWKGATLAEFGKGRRISAYETRLMLDDAAEGLLALHEAMLYHGGASPLSLLVAGRGRWVLMDSGFAAQSNQVLERAQGSSTPGAGSSGWGVSGTASASRGPDRAGDETISPVAGRALDIAGWGSLAGFCLTGLRDFGRAMVAGVATESFDIKAAQKSLIEASAPAQPAETVLRCIKAAETPSESFGGLAEAREAFFLSYC